MLFLWISSKATAQQQSLNICNCSCSRPKRLMNNAIHLPQFVLYCVECSTWGKPTKLPSTFLTKATNASGSSWYCQGALDTALLIQYSWNCQCELHRIGFWVTHNSAQVILTKDKGLFWNKGCLTTSSLVVLQCKVYVSLHFVLWGVSEQH